VSEDNLLRAAFDVVCHHKRHLYYVLGPNGKTIQKIAAEAKQELMNAFRRELSLRLIVKGSRVGIVNPDKDQYH
jgi:GTPase Era involved in 16S rRNA processing